MKIAFWITVIVLGPLALLSPVMLMSNCALGHQNECAIAMLGWWTFPVIYLTLLTFAFVYRKRAIGWIFIILPWVIFLGIGYFDSIGTS